MNEKPRNPNLRDISLTHEEAVDFGRRGGLASGIARQKRKLLRNTINDALNGRITDAQLAAALEDAGLPLTHQGAVVLALIEKAERGDVEAFRALRDTVGERPSEKLSLISDYQGRIDELDLSQLTDEELIALADGDDW